jgi:hypothetical protein
VKPPRSSHRATSPAPCATAGEASQQWKLLQTPGAFDSGKNLANVSKNVVLTPVGGLGDDAYYWP